MQKNLIGYFLLPHIFVNWLELIHWMSNLNLML